MAGSTRVRRARRAVLGTLALTGGMFSVGMTAAGAVPSGPNVSTGSFTCPGGVTGSFVAPGNSGGDKAADWSVAHLTFTSDGRGIFVPTALDLTFLINGLPAGSFSGTKGNAPSSVTCSIVSDKQSFPGGTFQFVGTVTGNIVTNG
jgi:hypothetical protein